jgi:hypothetical protein
MKTPALKEIKQELETLPAARVMELFLRLVRSRKENKELISYLLFESHNEAGYIENIRHEINEEFNSLPAATSYLTKKALRKILRTITRYSKQMGSKQAEVELRIYFCRKLKTSEIRLKRNTTLENIYDQQIKKIRGLIELLHEDLGHDYKRMLDEL